MTEPDTQDASRVQQGLRRYAPYIVVLIIGLFIGSMCSSSSDPATTEPTAQAEQADEVWTCSMHPQIQSPERGICPICGMDLVPNSSVSGATIADNQIHLTPRAQKLARIQTSDVFPTVLEGVERIMPGQERLRSATMFGSASRTVRMASSSSSLQSPRPRRARARPARPSDSRKRLASWASSTLWRCESRAWDRPSGSKVEPQAGATRKCCRWRTSTCTSQVISMPLQQRTTCSPQ